MVMVESQRIKAREPKKEQEDCILTKVLMRKASYESLEYMKDTAYV